MIAALVLCEMLGCDVRGLMGGLDLDHRQVFTRCEKWSRQITLSTVTPPGHP